MNPARIARLRRERGWTQERLAAESGVGVRTIQRLEAGNDASPETLSLLAKAFDTTVRELFAPAAELPDLEAPVVVPPARWRVASGAVGRVRRGGVAAIRRSLAVVLALAVLGAVAGLGLVVLHPPVYRATATAFVSTPTGGKPVLVGTASFTHAVAASFADVATTPIVLSAVHSDPSIALPVGTLGRMVTATVPPDTALLRVTARASSPTLAVRIANAVVRRLSTVAPSLQPSGGTRVHITLVRPATSSVTPIALVGPFLGGGGGGLAAGLLFALVVVVLRSRGPGRHGDPGAAQRIAIA